MNALPGGRITRHRWHELDRTAYLAALAVLQVALVVDVAPNIAAMLVPPADVATGAAWPPAAQATAQIAAYALSLAGAAIVLAFPALALACHAQSGRIRFLGLPPAGVRLAVGGALGYALAQTLALLAFASFAIAAAGVSTLAASLGTCTLAVMAAGTLTSELLRRGIAPVRVPIAPWACNPVRIEVIDPPELATRAR